ncbi:aldo/keto reductase [Acuticoccus kandeliae]|uniref:aldo/keto reductase n=1 Tax=Acuticoccus kandeliae TaxID=2073160 RepID=UPI000D3EB7D9|nr:aldo/keto reductase [Acuticoccus kandeliae]
MPTPLETKTLTTRAGRSLTFSALGTGTAPLGNLYGSIDEPTAQATLEAAYAAGSRYFDTAPLYGFGLSERRLGTFWRTNRPADALLSTKAGRILKRGPRDPDMQPTQWFDVPARDFDYDYTYDGIMRSFEFSLERLGVDHVDILYCHDIDVWTHGSEAAAMACVRTFLESGHRAFVALRDEGVIDAFGLGVNEWEVCQHVAERVEIDLFLLAGRYTLLEQEALASMLPLCEENGIGVVIGGPYNSGILATGAVEGAHFDYKPAPPAILDRVRRIEAVCKEHGVRLRDAALRFPLCHPAVLCVIPGGVKPEEIAGTAAALSAEIPAELWQALKREGLLRQDAPVPS